jgi:NitT/TauT family transport system substrate-binding protein
MHKSIAVTSPAPDRREVRHRTAGEAARRLLRAACLAFALPAFAAGAGAETKMTVAVSSTSFAWLPLYVAEGAGLFKEEGLAVEIVNIKDGAAVTAALLNGNADVAGIGANSLFAARERKQPMVMLTPMTVEYTSNVFARAELLKEKGIDGNAPIKARVEALKGTKIGVISFGGGQHNILKFLMRQYGDADIDDVAEIIPVGDASATLAAMRRGAIDVSAFSPPVPERAVKDGYGAILINMIRGDVPETRGMVVTGLAVVEPQLEKNKEALAAFVRAIDRADKLVHADLAKAGKGARKYFSAMPDDVFELGMAAMQPATPKGAEVSTEGLMQYYRVLASGGSTFAQGSFDAEAAVANDFVRAALAAKKAN